METKSALLMAGAGRAGLDGICGVLMARAVWLGSRGVEMWNLLVGKDAVVAERPRLGRNHRN